MSGSGSDTWSVYTERRYGHSGRAVRGAVESGWMWILPERSNDHLPGVPDGDRDTATTARKDGDDGSDAVVRHERRRDSGSGDSADERDAGQLQPDKGDDPCAGEPARDRIPGCVLWRGR